MSRTPAYGPAAQTPAQRAEVLARMQQALPRRRRSAQAQQLQAQYLAGELTWLQVYQALGAEASRPSPWRANRRALPA